MKRIGGILNGILLREGLVDKISILISPSLVGGTTPQSIFQADDCTASGGRYIIGGMVSINSP